MPERTVRSSERFSSERLWRTFAEGVRAFVRRRVPPAEADDIVQDLFLRIHENVASLRGEERVQAWIYTLARRTIADFYRRRARRPDAASAALPDTLAAHDGVHDVHEEVLSWLRPMIGALPEAYAAPLRWADVDGLPQQEIADRLGLSLSGAKSRVQRARQKLGDVLADCCAVEFGPEGRAVGFYRHRPTHDAACCNS